MPDARRSKRPRAGAVASSSGTTPAAYGPGGGGGGGFAILRGAPDCTAQLEGGPHGWLEQDRVYGGEDSQPGVVER